jgi:ATP-binding cassette subfamily F protein uup
MHFLSAEGISKSYGIKPLFSNISFHINEGDKIALVAKNGSGKSTLLHILAGKETPDEGNVWVHKDIRVVLFEQDIALDQSQSILEYIFQQDHPIIHAVKHYEAVSASHDTEALGKAIIQMDELGAWNFEAKVKQVLGRLNIHNLQQPISTLSGGQKKRVALAQTLIDAGFDHNGVLLIMDEPTNHLDIEMVEWLEYFLNQEKITLLLVTHDRYFLDEVCNEIWELDEQSLFTYKGNYAYYLEQKAARAENVQAHLDKMKNLYRKELEWMRKQPKARTTKAKSREDRFETIEAVVKQKKSDLTLELQMKMSRLGGKVVELKKIYKSFGEKRILKGFDYTFKKGERIGIIGPNGTGKSTFLEILQGNQLPDSGKINIGDTVVFGNFSQQGLLYKEDMRVIEYVKTFAESFPLAGGGSLSAAQFLQLFLFSPEQQYTYLSKLSGGEKKRLQLLTVLFKNPNFLILDEPTNDLDLPTLSVLENFLLDFPGCLVIVSHDRYFMDRIVDHLLVFEGDGVISDFPGNYQQYREEVKKNEVSQKLEIKSINQSTPKPSKTSGKKKRSYNEQRELEKLELEIPELENQKISLTEAMSNPDISYENLEALSKQLIEVTQLLEEKELLPIRVVRLTDISYT